MASDNQQTTQPATPADSNSVYIDAKNIRASDGTSGEAATFPPART